MIQNAKVLLVCDDPVNRSAWTSCLESQRIQVVRADSSDQALQQWADEIPDLALIDLFDARQSGLALCASLRELAVIPILVFLPSYDEQLVLQCYRAGADETVVKPLSPAVFCAKVSAWLRRSRSVPVNGLSDVEQSGLCLESEQRQVVLPSGQRVRLSNLEFRMLLLFMNNPGRVYEPGELVTQVWGYAAGSDTVVLKNLVYRLRRKIEADPEQPHFLLTHGGHGYSFQG